MAKNRSAGRPAQAYTGPCIYRGCTQRATPLHLTCDTHAEAMTPETRKALLGLKLNLSTRDRTAWYNRALREVQEHADAHGVELQGPRPLDDWKQSGRRKTL